MHTIEIAFPREKPVLVPADSAGMQLKQVVESFIPRFVKDASLIYMALDHVNPLFVSEERFTQVQVPLPTSDSAPELLVYCHDRKWLFLISVGRADRFWSPERCQATHADFGPWKDALVRVSCFASRQTTAPVLDRIAWDTDVWCADEPEHLIYLGPLPRWNDTIRMR